MAVQGLKWHYDVTGAEPIVRDIRVYHVGALPKGTALCGGPVATANNQGCAIIPNPVDLDNIIGVLQEDLTAAQALSVVATGVDKYAKLIINPFAVWLGVYSQHADDDVVNSVADSTGKTLTITQVTDHERGWGYITGTGSTTGGAGNLFQIGASTNATSITAATDYDDNLKGTNTSDTCIVLIPPFTADVAAGSVNLSAATGQVCAQIEPYNATAAAGAAIILENYMVSSNVPFGPLVCALHSGYNYDYNTVQLFGDLMFSETLLGHGGTICDRLIN